MTTGHLTWDSTCHILLLLLSFPKWWLNGCQHENGADRNEIWDRSKVKALRFCRIQSAFLSLHEEFGVGGMHNDVLLHTTHWVGIKRLQQPYPGFVHLSHEESDVKIRGEGCPPQSWPWHLNLNFHILVTDWKTAPQFYMHKYCFY